MKTARPPSAGQSHMELRGHGFALRHSGKACEPCLTFPAVIHEFSASTASGDESPGASSACL